MVKISCFFILTNGLNLGEYYSLKIQIANLKDSIPFDSICLSVKELQVDGVIIHTHTDSNSMIRFDSVSLKSRDISQLNVQADIVLFNVSVVDDKGRLVCHSFTDKNLFKGLGQDCIDALPRRYGVFRRRAKYTLKVTFVRFRIDNQEFRRHLNTSYHL